MLGYFPFSNQRGVTVVDGSTPTGIFGPNGTYNVVPVDAGGTPKGIYHPCGAFNVVSVEALTSTYDANGAYNVLSTVDGMEGGGGPGPSYADLLSEIANKGLVFNSGSSLATAGDTLTTTPWDNEVSATNATGSPTWETGIFGAKRGVLSNGAGELIETGVPYSTLVPSGQSFTAFFVHQCAISTSERRFLFDGTNGALRIFTSGNAREVRFTANAVSFGSGLSFTDDVQFVLGVRVTSTGAVRFNLSGLTADFPSAGVSRPSPDTGNIRLGWSLGSTGNTYTGGHVFANTEMTDGDMDAFVVAVKTEYGVA
jgi:hypothetical protein